MVIDQIDVGGLPTRDAEHDAPIRAHCDGPKAFQIALERVQAKARQVHIVGRFGAVQDEKNILGFLDQVGTNAFPIPVLEKPLQSLVPKILYHNLL
jgi:hypothetical protein